MAAAPLVGARAALVLALALAAAAASGRPPPPRPVVAAYIPEWRARAVNYTALFAHATHAIFFSLEVDGKAGKPSARDRLPPKEVLDEVHGALRAANAKVDVATPPTRRHAVLCFGGNGRSAGFMGMAKNKKRRSRFVKALVDELAFTGFTGVDYNWEYPGYDMSTGRYLDETSVANEYAALADLVADTRRAFEKYNAKLGADDPQARLTEISVAYVHERDPPPCSWLIALTSSHPATLAGTTPTPARSGCWLNMALRRRRTSCTPWRTTRAVPKGTRRCSSRRAWWTKRFRCSARASPQR